jgi:hypothetical protein
MRRFTGGYTARLTATATLLVLSSQASAVLLYSSNVRNTTAPGSLTNNSGAWTPGGPDDPRRLLNSGWQWTGSFGAFSGIAIGSQYFVTAKHAGAIASTINVNGVNYTIDTNFNIPNTQYWKDDPNTDLRIFKITGTFASFAPLYSETPGSEIGRRLVAIGRGTQRGAEVRVNGELKGWKWGPIDGVMSWGENVVTGRFNQAGFGQLMYFDFDRDGGPNECALSDHDSSGGVFIQSGGQWKLAGVSLAVDGPWHLDVAGSPGPQFDGSMFDAGGLWIGSANPQYIDETIQDNPGSSYATMISPNLSWINSVIGAGAEVPEPTGATMLLLGAAGLLRRRKIG